MRKVDVVVVGAGQAGLATSYYLTRRGIEHTVLERGDIPGDSWRSRRWDSFMLNGPNFSFDLPGYPYDGPEPDAFMARDEIVSRFGTYASRIAAPVQSQTAVLRLDRAADGHYRATTTSGEVEARAVVVATGAYQKRHRPPQTIDPAIVQMHTDQYRNPARLPPGGVLVVGAGQSGCQVVEDLLAAGRPTWVSAGSCGWIPRRYRGQDNVRWRQQMGVFDDTVEQLGHSLRLACPPMQTGVGWDRDINLRTLRAQGATLLGRFLAADGFTATFADDLNQSAARSDEAAVRFRAQVDDFIAANRIDAPTEPPIQPSTGLPEPPTTLDLKANNIATVIWASGFRLDFENWIALPLNTVDGYPEQTQGVSRHAGLYFMGLQLMHTRKSGLIFGVGEDAAHVAQHVETYLSSGASAPIG